MQVDRRRVEGNAIVDCREYLLVDRECVKGVLVVHRGCNGLVRHRVLEPWVVSRAAQRSRESLFVCLHDFEVVPAWRGGVARQN